MMMIIIIMMPLAVMRAAGGDSECGLRALIQVGGGTREEGEDVIGT